MNITKNPVIFKSEVINLSLLYVNTILRKSPEMYKLDYLQYLFSILNY